MEANQSATGFLLQHFARARQLDHQVDVDVNHGHPFSPWMCRSVLNNKRASSLMNAERRSYSLCREAL